jgi:hypothetical protein
MAKFHWLRFGQNGRGAEDQEILRGGGCHTLVSFQAIAQFSMLSPGTRANSKVFAVISATPECMQQQKKCHAERSAQRQD